MSMRQEDLAKKQRFERLKVTFEEVKTMQMMGYNLDEMISALKLHPDYLYFVNQYITIHAGEDLEEVIHKAYELLYSEDVPLKPKEEQKSGINTKKEAEGDSETMEQICTRRLLKDFISARVEFMMCKLMAKNFNVRDFAACGYDRKYTMTMLHIIRLFCPSEITRETIQDDKIIRAIVDRIYEELYVLTNRKKMWSCDKLDFEGLKMFRGRY